MGWVASPISSASLASVSASSSRPASRTRPARGKVANHQRARSTSEALCWISSTHLDERIPEAGGQAPQLGGCGPAFVEHGGIPDGGAAGEEHAGQGGAVAEATGESQGFVAQLPAAVAVGAEHELGGQDGEQAGPHHVFPVAPGPQGRLQDRHPLGVDAEAPVPEAPVAGQPGPGQPIGVAHPFRPLGRFPEGGPVTGLTPVVLGLAERDEEVDPPRLLEGLFGNVGQLECLAVVAGRLVVGQLDEGAVPGPSGVHRRPAGVGGRSRRPPPVVGQGGQVVVKAVGVDCLDGLGHPAVEGHPAKGGEPVVDGVPDQGVGEAVAPPGRLQDEAGSDRLLQGGDQFLFLEIARHLDQGQLELGPHDRRRAQHPVGPAGEVGQPLPHHLPHPLRDAHLLDRQQGRPAATPALQGPRLSQVPQHLDHEERVAVGLLVDGPGQEQLVVGEGVAAGPLHELSHAGGVEALERQPLHAPLAAEVGQDLDERVIVAEIDVAVDAQGEESYRL
jgi:hypothetical protein